jgi:hypothetical protein
MADTDKQYSVDMKYSDESEIIDPENGNSTYSKINYKFEVNCSSLNKLEWSTLTVTPNIKAPDMNLVKV